jgi:molecular chaperone DnaK
MAKDNRTIGKFHLDGFPPARRGVPQIEVIFDIDANGIINVSAVDKATNKTQSIRIESSSGLSKEDIERMKQEAEMNAESDKQLKEDADTLNSADSLMFQVGKSMEDLNEKISETEKTEINSKVEKLREAYDRKDIPEVKTLTEEVNKKFQDISQNLYSSTNENKDEVNDQDFESVDFEEVK